MSSERERERKQKRGRERLIENVERGRRIKKELKKEEDNIHTYT